MQIYRHIMPNLFRQNQALRKAMSTTTTDLQKACKKVEAAYKSGDYATVLKAIQAIKHPTYKSDPNVLKLVAECHLRLKEEHEKEYEITTKQIKYQLSKLPPEKPDSISKK